MFPQSTTGRYIPGVGTTITKANIRRFQEQRAKEGLPLATPEEIHKEFVRHPKPKERHVNRINSYLGSVPMQRE